MVGELSLHSHHCGKCGILHLQLTSTFRYATLDMGESYTGSSRQLPNLAAVVRMSVVVGKILAFDCVPCPSWVLVDGTQYRPARIANCLKHQGHGNGESVYQKSWCQPNLEVESPWDIRQRLLVSPNGEL